MAESKPVIGASSSDITHYIAIDFGTSGCGIAVWNTKLRPDEPEVYTNPKWVPGAKGVAVKCPTVLLLDHNGEFEAFGLKALQNYQNGKRGLRHPEEVDNYYLFTRFKMCLYDEKHLSRRLMIKAANGKELPAHVVFTKSLKEIKEVILKELEERIGGSTNKIQWILTVPAIWGPASKQIMREAATEAGLGVDDGSALELVLEPEAAALYCQKEILNVNAQDSKITSHYLVVDCGGGTLDIAAHKLTKKKDGEVFIEEIHQAHGGPYGGFIVNDEFEKMLQKLFQLSHTDLAEVKQKYPRQWTKVVHENFEYNKYSIDSNSNTPITVSLPKKIKEFVESKTGKAMEELMSDYTRHNVEWDDDDEGVVLPISTITSLFSPVITQIIMAIEDVLKKPECKCIEKILMVGGFSESNILFSEVKKRFSPSVTVEKSSTPSLSVLKGAVIFAMHKNIIRSRKMRQSIGIETWDDFVPSFHDERKKVHAGDKHFCKNIFTKFVEINESVPSDHSIKYEFTPATEGQGTCKIRIIGSRDDKALYTDESCCYEVGQMTIDDLPSSNSRLSRAVEIGLNVSGTEFTVKAFCNNSTKELHAKLNCVKDEYT